jgi:hypothetical protein
MARFIPCVGVTGARYLNFDLVVQISEDEGTRGSILLLSTGATITIKESPGELVKLVQVAQGER